MQNRGPSRHTIVRGLVTERLGEPSATLGSGDRFDSVELLLISSTM
jgi:hypothetical protein